MAWTRPSFPQGVSPHTPLPQSAKAEDLNPDLDLGVKRRIVKSTGLVSRQWIPWHCSAIAILGPQTYIDIADEAKRGKDPHTLFSWLLKQELSDGE